MIAVVALAGPAWAHDPLFLTEDDRTPQSGPLLPDGTISFALYGEIGGEGDSRGLQVRFQDGDALFVELLVPDESPENLLAEEDLPLARVVAPDGSEVTIGGSLEGSFFEPFTSTSYLRLGSVSDVAVAGTYDVWIEGPAPARFTIAVGTRETFGTPVERVDERPGSFTDITEALDAWLETPPSALPMAAEPSGESAEPDVVSEPPAPAVEDPVVPAPEPDLSAAEAVPAPSPDADADGVPVLLVAAAVAALIAPALAGWVVRRRSQRTG